MENKRKELELREKELEIKKIKITGNTTTINSNNNNTNITNNITNNITVKFGEENVDHITMKQFYNMITNGYKGDVELFVLTHFSDLKRENNNVRLLMARNKEKFQIYNGNMWRSVEFDELIKNVARNQKILYIKNFITKDKSLSRDFRLNITKNRLVPMFDCPSDYYDPFSKGIKMVLEDYYQ